MYPELSGKRVLVTGGTRGIGRAIALRFGQEGSRVVVNYRRSRTEAHDVVREIYDAGGEATPLRGDVGSKESVERLFDGIGAELGGIDVIVANAAFGVPGPLLEATDRHWHATMSATAQSLLTLVQRALPLMNPSGGRVISMTSHGGRRVLPGYGIVGPAKAAMESLTRALAVELAARCINVNGVLAGLCDTKSFRAIPGADESVEGTLQKTPMGRLTAPNDVANTVAFLASDQASMICGQFIVVDGGWEITA